MSTKADVEAALERLSQAADVLDDATRQRIPDRSVSVHLLDLDAAYAGRFAGGLLSDVAAVDPESAKNATFRLTCSSDDFIALIDGELGFGPAWASGRIRISAGWRDLLELRKFL
jgi:hypothetical protein